MLSKINSSWGPRWELGSCGLEALEQRLSRMGKGPSQKVRGGEPWGSLRLHLSVRLAGLAVLSFPRFWEGMERELSIPLSSLYSPSDWGLYAPPSLSLSLNFASLCLFRPGLSSPGCRGGLVFFFFSLRPSLPPPPLSRSPSPPPSLRPEALWEETRCGARAARGEARSAGPGGRSQWGARTAARAAGGRGRGAISGGAARRASSAAERSGAVKRQRGAGPAGGQAGARRSAGGRESSRADGGARPGPAGAGDRGGGGGGGCCRRSRGYTALPAPCLRPSLLPRGLVRTRPREGERWVGAAARSRAGFGVTPPAPLPPRAAPPCALATLGARPGPRAAEVCPPPQSPGSLPAPRGGPWCRGRGRAVERTRA